jgi:GNAT superfamily N-acetyltransferase
VIDAASPPPALPKRSPPPRADIVLRKGRIADTRRLVRFYLALSPAARYRFHPFRFDPFFSGLFFFASLAAQAVFGTIAPRSAYLLVGLMVAEVQGDRRIAGYGTMRGVPRKGLEPRVRFGFVVGDDFRGYGIGPKILRGLAQVAVDRGMRWEIGAVFRSDALAIKALTKFGVKFSETDYIDPRAPRELNYFTEGDLFEILRLIPENPPATPPAPSGVLGAGRAAAEP